MKQLTYWEQLWWDMSGYFIGWYRRLTCWHPRVVTLATMDTLKGDIRTSLWAVCEDCSMDFHVVIPANKEDFIRIMDDLPVTE